MNKRLRIITCRNEDAVSIYLMADAAPMPIINQFRIPYLGANREERERSNDVLKAVIVMYRIKNNTINETSTITFRLIME